MLPLQDKEFFKTFFDLKHVKDTVTVVIKKGPNRRRIKSIMVLVCLATIDGPNMGKQHIILLLNVVCNVPDH